MDGCAVCCADDIMALALRGWNLMRGESCRYVLDVRDDKGKEGILMWTYDDGTGDTMHDARFEVRIA